ncbi:glycerol uptake protein 1 [Trichodelitschia bisporula]|uniref:Glycerol uptake protein 1 n=1 Tax=Trichodelitschia bisporula TaxID=703511 RepID=A0A6G1HVI7_9PEZI|nr:glycerol uptake protein 1 [Trichodelitschia bisporula]
MGFLDFFCKLYSLDTLDTRFTTSSTTPPRPTEHELVVDPNRASLGETESSSSTNAASQRSGSSPQRSLWGTPEFCLYYLVLAFAIPMMFKVSFDVSKSSHPSYASYSHLLSDGWIPGRKVDNSDGQYSSFRDNIPYLAILLVAHPLLRGMYDGFWRTGTYTNVPSSTKRSDLTYGLSAAAAADTRLEQRISFDYYFAFIFLVALHGTSAIKVIMILYVNYKIAKSIPKSYIPAATWIFDIGILFANELYRGYPFAGMLRQILSNPASGQSMLVNWGVWLDNHGGLIPRWEVLFNLTILRLISFNMDYYWSLNLRGGSPVEKKQLDPANLSERDRVSTSARAVDYSFRNYIAYTLYSPLYLAGPIITFNDYISQLRYKTPSLTRERTVLYAIRFAITLLMMELVLHFIYVVAIFKEQPNWNLYTPFQLSMLGYFNLHIIWLKLLIPWRFFRLWALIDGVDPPENMVRCMSNNYSALAFWRGWHRSYNRWIVRYVYAPLGGSTTPGLWGRVRNIGNFLIVFTFVALWHDINLRLLMWGWLITLFVLPEIIASFAFPARKWRDRPNAYRVICGIGAVANILMMMIANLVGFAIGVDGLKGLLHGILGSSSGLLFFTTACGALFVGAQVMFEVRETEKRDGVRLKC